jgi:hypothetical protein
MPKSVPYLNLETINKDGSVPESRLNDPVAVQAIVQEMISANDKRSKTDSIVQGMISGNPPYSQAKLRSEAQGWRSNANFRIAESFLNTALTPYWDLITEARTKCEVRTAHGNDDQIEDWSGVITEEFERMNQADTSLNYMFRLSQHDMVAFRNGPVMFDDAYGIQARAIKQSKLLVEDGSPSNVNEWSIAVALVDYKADELYGYIRNPSSAEKIGYNIKEVRKALLDHAPASFYPRNRRNDWMFYEQQVRNNDLHVSRVTDDIPVAHVWYREFPKEEQACGRISHCMVLETGEPENFLFRHVGRYEKWQNIIHPFYYDTGDGTHHSVKGLGIKAYAALELYNRLENHLVDSAFFGSSAHMQARDPAALQNLALIQMGPWFIHQPGLELMDVNIGANLDAPMAIKQDLVNTLTSNLAQYRQDVQRRRHGSEPPTARQINYESENENVIGKSGMTWYCEQLDDFWTERYRRAANPNILATNKGGKEALAFQKRCRDRGVAPEAIIKTEYVRATRTIGMGSADSRMQTMARILGRLPLYDEAGRRKIVEDVTAADVGWSQMRRYISKQGESAYVADQRAEARQWLGSMKLGIAPEVTPSQNPVVYAGVWLKAAADAAQSLQQGANPMEVFSFLEVIGPAIRAQLDRFSGDPTRKEVYEAMDKEWRKLSALHDQLRSSIEKQRNEQMKQRQQTQQQASEVQGKLGVKRMESAGKLDISREKQQANLQLKREAHQQNLAIKGQKAAQDAAVTDVLTAAEIRKKAASVKKQPE